MNRHKRYAFAALLGVMMLGASPGLAGVGRLDADAIARRKGLACKLATWCLSMRRCLAYGLWLFVCFVSFVVDQQRLGRSALPLTLSLFHGGERTLGPVQHDNPCVSAPPRLCVE